MSHPTPISIPASPELIDLCQAQVTLLTQGLGAAWCAVYLTEEFADNGPKLVPAIVYPEGSPLWQPGDLGNRVNSKRLLAAALPGETQEVFDEVDFPQDGGDAWGETALRQGYQIVLPLIYEEGVMGLLVTGRKERKWKKQELTQIEQVARTLAIACLLDRRQHWYQQQLGEQVRLRQAQQQILDDWLHQFRNPLTALRTFGKLLLKRLFPEDRNRQTAESILRESDRLQDLLQQFDDYVDSLEVEIATLSPSDLRQLLSSQSNSIDTVATTPTASLYLLPDNRVKREPLNVATVLEPLILSAEAIAQERGLTLHANLPSALPPIQADARALREVLSNAIDNALKYTPAGGWVEIEAGLEKEGMQGIAIADNGPGIPPEDRERLFERHYRGIQANGDIPGTGLGLAIAKELVEQMQGKIEVISPTVPDRANGTRYSNLGGTTSIVWLPLANSSHHEPPELGEGELMG
jgi:signal transduction histidine kinase